MFLHVSKWTKRLGF